MTHASVAGSALEMPADLVSPISSGTRIRLTGICAPSAAACRATSRRRPKGNCAARSHS
jgi:hypothetical protein